MSLNTHSKFFYGWEVDATNRKLDFNEGVGQLTASLRIGDYTLTEFCDEIARAMNDVADSYIYTCSVDRDTRKISIEADGVFSLLVTSGTHLGTSVFATAGFTGADKTGDDEYEAQEASGNVYSTQFILQDHVASEDYRKAVDATVNKSASGKVEVFQFGEEAFVQFNLKYVSDNPVAASSAHVFRENLTGIDDLRDFMQYLIRKKPVEYMPDEDETDEFEKLILESTPDDSKGVGYKLKELYGQGMPGWYETGLLKMRVVD